MSNCKVCGMRVDESKSPSMEYRGKRYYFASRMHRLIFSLYPDLVLNRNDNAFGDEPVDGSTGPSEES